VPGGADLVTYWFEQARAQIEAGQCHQAGLVATNSIRGGANQKVLARICASSSIFNAWSDLPWVNNGAAVRVSLVCFGQYDGVVLDGQSVATIHPDLTAGDGLNLTQAKALFSNFGTSFIGTQKNGPFDISGDTARAWLKVPNPNNKPNSDVLRPWVNGINITQRWTDTWIIDFDKMTEADASLYESPFAHVLLHVKQTRINLRRDWHRLHWWCHGDPRPALKIKLKTSSRQIITPRVSKHRVFAWFASSVLPDSAVVAIARADDSTFGILHSRFHELWSLRMCTWMGVGNDPRYTPTTCFETFPFPAGLTPEDTAHQRTEKLPSGAIIPAGIANPALCSIASAIAQAAATLTTQRNNWLNPEKYVEWVQTPEEKDAGYPARAVAKPGFADELKKRTLTNLYNEKPAWLLMAHAALDQAVAAAYGWTDYTPSLSDDELLRRLLALNLSPLSSEESQP
jgi:hypothetical protein